MAGKQIALLIGNGTFGADSGFAHLRCPPNDVKSMGEMLQNKAHGDFLVTSLTDATQRQITKAIYDTLNTSAGFDDTVVVYYSGHGCPDDDGTLFLAAADSDKEELPVTAVPVDFLVTRMRAAKSQKIFLILDCCFSGSIEKCFTKGDVSDQVKSALPKQFSGSGNYVLTASTDTQLAEEKESDQNSLLTKHILSGIIDGTADQDDDGIVTIHELVVHVQRTVSQEGSQRPLGFELRAGGGEMVFARTGLSNQAVKTKEVEEAVWKARDEYHIPMKTAQCVWSMISDEELKRDGDAARRRLNKLHSLIGEPSAFVTEIYELAEAAQRNSAIQATAHHAAEQQPQPPTASSTPLAQPQTQAPAPPKQHAPRPKQPVAAPAPHAAPPPSPSYVPQQQFVQPQAPFLPVSGTKPRNKWRPLIIAVSIVGGIFAILLLIGVGIGITAGIKQGINEPSKTFEPSTSTNATVPSMTVPNASGMIFSFSNGSCGGFIYQQNETRWMNALTGACTSTNGPVIEVNRSATNVLLKGLKGGYASIPLSGGAVTISSTGPEGPWVIWGYAQRVDKGSD